MTFEVGALVSARGREWVVQPESTKELMLLRPLGGDDDQVTGIFTPLESVVEATFPEPDPSTHQGNHRSCALLRDAVRLGFRSGAGPFRALARVAVEPRPYQLVPLLLALKMDPVRLLIADDVGVGKTVEACLIAREMLDRAEIRQFTVLCPPHLAEQWQRALRDQFHIDAQLVLASTAARLETDGVSLFERHRFTVVSTDYIKGQKRREEFLRTCPEFVIVDEAHTCAASSRAAQRRHELLRQLVDPEKEQGRNRHLLLVTATPHSGKDDAFRSLLGLLDRDFDHLPEDIAGKANEHHRDHLARHFVQRRRGDIKAYLDTETPFPDREQDTDRYKMSPAYKDFLEEMVDFCSEQIFDEGIDGRRRRIRWWSALSLLRSVSSSPAAAAATLRNRGGVADCDNEQTINEEGRRLVLDPEESGSEGNEHSLGAQTEDSDAHRQTLLAFAKRAEALRGAKDNKLKGLVKRVGQLLHEGFMPIIFCRFIPTVDYLVEALRKKFEKKGVRIEAVTGQVPPDDREARIELLGGHEQRVLVCTDCLSEGINLQRHFSAVIHYDLAWNPTRHEQREGRVDRYGQPESIVRVLTYYGSDNPVDGTVLQVLQRKHKKIQGQLGVSVFVAVSAEEVEDQILNGIFLRGDMVKLQRSLDFGFRPPPLREELDWEDAAEREQQSYTKYAQRGLLNAVNKEVAYELDEVRLSQGDHKTVRDFIDRGLPALGVPVLHPPGDAEDEYRIINLAEAPAAITDALGRADRFRVAFQPGFCRNAEVLTRTHPLVDGLARYLLEDALNPEGRGPARRCGVVRTRLVNRRTTVLLLRLRFHILTKDRNGVSQPLLAEEMLTAAFAGAPAKAEWLPQEQISPLFLAQPAGNIAADLARDQLRRVLDGYEYLKPHLQALGKERGAALLESHRRVRRASRTADRGLSVKTHAPPDVLGLYIYLPAGGEG